MEKIIELLKKSGYSDKAIEYYMKRLNVGDIENPSAHFEYTGPCGDTMEFYLTIESGIVKDVKFQAIGCAGSYSSGSALAEMIKGKKIEQVKDLSVEDITNHLGGLPDQKIHCALLAKRTLEKAIGEYRKQ
ncbi:MAG: iron-sulfur cluster assembly scaffold protein [Gemmatimonadota bacterium]|nr:iron-sulfur cluster assembly scaffold protein [Gemmatimonadota bacterium]